MTLTISYTKVRFFKFKGKEDPNIYIREFYNIYWINMKIIDEDKLTLFLIILNKKALKYIWYPIRHFISWKELRDIFIIYFREKISDREVINNLLHIKQKKGEDVEESF